MKKFPHANILVVDDYPLSQEIMNSLLGAFGCTIFRADSGAEAVEFCKAKVRPDLIFMDLVMPGMGGLEATKEIRKLQESLAPRAVIIGFSAGDEKTDRLKSLDAGMDDFIAKPISLEAIERILEKYLSPVPSPGDTSDKFPQKASSPRGQRHNIRSIAPCGQFVREEVDKGEELLTKLGFSIEKPTVKRDPYLNYFNGTDDERLNELNSAFTTPGTDVVWLARGGSGILRLIKQLSFQRTDKLPIFVGFSDGTAMLSHLWGDFKCAGIHGPNIKNLPEQSESSMKALLKLLAGHGREIEYPDLEILQAQTGVQSVEGTLIVGNLRVLTHLIGTSALPLGQPTILVLEDINEESYRIEQMLAQLSASASLNQVQAIVLGQFINCGDISLVKKIFMDYSLRLGFSLFAGIPCGHDGENWALPFGVRVRVEIAGTVAKLRILQELN